MIFVERDLLEWLAGLEPGQDGYGNELMKEKVMTS